MNPTHQPQPNSNHRRTCGRGTACSVCTRRQQRHSPGNPSASADVEQCVYDTIEVALLAQRIDEAQLFRIYAGRRTWQPGRFPDIFEQFSEN